MKFSLLDLLVCPKCRGPELELTGFRTDLRPDPPEVFDGILTCESCRAIYPVVAGIPRMLPDSFRRYYHYLSAWANGDLPSPPEEGRELTFFRKLHKPTEKSFSFEWLRYQVTGVRENTAFLQQEMGFRPSELAGKLVLDAGCGMGRYLEVVAGWGAEVVGMDLSRSVERAWQQTKHRSKVHLIQGDILRPPLKPKVFDSIYSIGVLHHTPDTRLAFESLCPLLLPGGRISVWVYRTFQPEIQVPFHKRVFASLAQLASDGTRLLTTRMPHRLLHYLCYTAAPLGWLKRKINGNRVLKHILWPLLLLPVSAHENWQVRLCDTFDWLAPQYQWKHRTREVMEWFRAACLAEVQPLARSVSVTGTRPECRKTVAGAPQQEDYAA